MEKVTVLGAGLAGSECAWQLAKRNIPVRLVEMKPEKKTPAHVSDGFAELVCSNSLRSDELTNAVGLLKAEMRALGSLIMESADQNRVAAGGALAVDREGFSRPRRSRKGSSSSRPGRCRPTRSPRRSPRSARRAICISTMPSRRSSRLRAWIWTAPFSPPATTRGQRIM